MPKVNRYQIEGVVPPTPFTETAEQRRSRILYQVEIGLAGLPINPDVDDALRPIDWLPGLLVEVGRLAASVRYTDRPTVEYGLRTILRDIMVLLYRWSESIERRYTASRGGNAGDPAGGPAETLDS